MTSSFFELQSKIIRKSPAARELWKRSHFVQDLLGTGGQNRVQPNLVIIGTQKAGTTSLHNYLAQHPDIFMSQFKEPGYFLDQTDELTQGTSRNRLRLNLDDDSLLRLISLGYGGERWFGESSTYYTMHPVIGGEVPANIAKRSPDAKLIYILRHPYGRIVSQFLWGERNNFAQGTFNEVLEKRFDVMLAFSSYASQLKRYLAHFSKDQILVLPFEGLSNQPEALVRNVFDFLDVDPAPAGAIDFSPKYTSKNREAHSAESLLFDSTLFDRLNAVIPGEMEELAALTGFDPSHWDLSEDKWVSKSSD